MSKVFKIAGILAVVFLIWQVGRCFYMVACISCTFPLIKTYEYSGNVGQFDEAVQVLSKENKDVTYAFTNMKDDGVSRQIEIGINSATDSISYQVSCNQIGSNSSEIGIIGAFDRTPKVFLGGYGIKADGVKELVSKFENDFLVRLRKSQHITLIPKD